MIFLFLKYTLIKNLITEHLQVKEDIVLEDNELVCMLTNEVKKIKAVEDNLQSIILMLNEEYGFDLEDMERDFTIEYIDPDTERPENSK